MIAYILRRLNGDLRHPSALRTSSVFGAIVVLGSIAVLTACADTPDTTLIQDVHIIDGNIRSHANAMRASGFAAVADARN